ncbi:unnamed protein product [Gongylonema pulchrum]|uniref:BAR domain-containing protein n=1 Tax=Gongylonema pulchrum TaxID=637853 RepID=A0A183DWG5_9BILA|nr:unnamed protein product [Gongylonema pulchrum]
MPSNECSASVSMEVDEGARKLFSKIQEAESLLQRVCTYFAEVEGSEKLQNKLKAELKFLNGLRDVTPSILERYLATSNVTHFRGLLDVAMRRLPSCTAFYKSFPEHPGIGTKRQIDLVVDDGATWMAQNHQYFFKPPEVVFEFVNGVPDMLARKLELIGVKVIGREVDINDVVKLPVDFSLHDACSDMLKGLETRCVESRHCEIEGSSVDTINLDVTAVFVLISSLTHENGAQYDYDSQLLNAQAAQERKKPALPLLLKAIKDKRLIICRTAYNSVQSILSTVAGPGEKARANELFKKVEIVEDKLSDRTATLKLSDQINERAKVIFGTGDYYKAVTATANRHFVFAAISQVW